MDATKAKEFATLFFSALQKASGNHFILNGQINAAASAFASNAELTIDVLKADPVAVELMRELTRQPLL